MASITRRNLDRIVALLLMALAAGCAATSPVNRPPSTEAVIPHENLNSVLWVQSSVEYEALTRQAFRQAEGTLREAMGDPTWTASLEQLAAGGFEGRPPAVVLDVDETVLDNSAYQARLILDAETYNSQSWNDWAREAAAKAVPGALSFTREADRLGITVIYLTNRREVIEEATRQNLAHLGFPITDSVDVILTRGEREAWSASDKTPRREYVADRYRILMLIGDNLGDFVSVEDRPPAERKASVSSYGDYWGTKWIMLPNPQYGSWEEAVIDFDFSAPPALQLRRKWESLDPQR